MQERNPLIRAKRRAGRVKRWAKRRLYERTIGREYKAWLADSMTREPGSIDNDITIGIVVPVFNPPVAFLEECIASVKAQTAKNWQLVVSDDGSTDEQTKSLLDRLNEEADPRIVVVRSPNGGISAACNRGIERITTEYFGWLDHDDALNPRAIEIFSETLSKRSNEQQSTVVIYSDEDKIDAKGRHYELYCKPDFSPELLLTQMYLCHFTAFKTEAVRELGGFRSSMDGAQDFDLALRLLTELNEQNVAHVSRPLYHWRAWSGSTALTIEAKPWAQEAAARAQREHLERICGGGTVAPSRVQGLNEVHPAVKPKKVSVIIPTIGTQDAKGRRMVEAAVKSLRVKEMVTELEIIAVTTGVIDPIKGVDVQVVYETKAFNFAGAINFGRSHATGDYLLLLNDDTTSITDNPVTRMLEIAELDGVGIVGCMLTYPDGRLQHVGIVLLPSGPTHPFIGKSGNDYGYFGSTLTPRNASAVTAAAMLVATQTFDAVGGFDTAFARDFNDVDFCLRVRESGIRVAWTPYARFDHHEGASIIRRKASEAEATLFTQRWSGALAADPYYSKALNPTLERIYEAL